MAHSVASSTSMGVGALIGVAVAAVAFLVTHEMSPVLVIVVPLVAVGSLIGAFAAVRYLEVERSVLWFLIGLAITIPTAYLSFKKLEWFVPGPKPPIAKVELPGFAIGIPGTEVRKFTTEYDFGWLYHVDEARNLQITVVWTDGLLDDTVARPKDAASWLSAFGWDETLTGALPERAFTWPDLETRTFKIFVGLSRHDATFIACGARLIGVVTWGKSRRDAERIHRRTVSTFECTPVPEEEAGVGKPPPVTITVPEGWRSVTDFPLWTVWTSDNASLVFRYQYRGHEQLSDMGKMVTDAVGHWGTVELKGSERVGEIDFWHGTLTDDKGQDQLLAYTTMCGRRPMLAVLFGRADLEEGRAALLAARCE